MCGIAGIINRSGRVDEKMLDGMTDCLAHRGPDGRGVWLNKNKTVGLGQRRLAIIDLSDGGRQPRVSPDGQVAITFNGEIYNYPDLKNELQGKGWQFTSMSDTEVLLISYLEWGKDCLQRLNGMFAFAIWDGRSNELFAARDRLGERPFKYYFTPEKFIFASEIKALLKDSSVPRETDWRAVDIALSFRYIPAPATGFKNIYKLPAGHYLVWKNGTVSINKYWDPAVTVEVDPDAYSSVNLWKLFKDSVRMRMISDKPIGAFLSGGLDSTSVVAAMSEVGNRPVESFVISLGGRSPDMEYAKIAAEHFKTNHHEIELPEINFEEILEKLIGQYDEPFFDQSALPSIVINQAIKKSATVVLSGDGGDELFGGYEAYGFSRFLQKYTNMPNLVKILLEKITSISAKSHYRIETINQDFFRAYSDYFSLWKSALPKSHYYLTKSDLYLENVKRQISDSSTPELMRNWFGNSKDIANAAMLADLRGRLPDGYLAKVDFASLNSAVEVRPPFLDYRLVELSQAIPSSKKINGRNVKMVWKDVVRGSIPEKILNRPKAGFGVPLHKILLKELKNLTEQTLLSSDARLNRYFSRPVIERLWLDNIKGRADYSNHIWSLLILELWLRKYIEK